MQFKFRAKFFPEDVAEEIIQDITLVCTRLSRVVQFCCRLKVVLALIWWTCVGRVVSDYKRHPHFLFSKRQLINHFVLVIVLTISNRDCFTCK